LLVEHYLVEDRFPHPIKSKQIFPVHVLERRQAREETGDS